MKRSWTRLFAISLLAVGLGAAADALRAQDAASMQAHHRALQHELLDNPFHRPLHLESSETAERVEGDVYARIDRPYASVGTLLQGADRWCDIMILHINVKRCRASPRDAGQTLSVTIGPKTDDPSDEGYDASFAYRVAAARADYLRIVLTADDGPLGTHDYRIVLEAVPLDRGRSFIHWSYAYGYGLAARMAMSAYLSTLGRDKVGFSVEQHDADGARRLVGGMRGVIERNTMRYYLAIEAYLGTAASPAGTASPWTLLDQRLRTWFAATERYPRQLHEVELDAYLEMKRRQIARPRMRLALRPARHRREASCGVDGPSGAGAPAAPGRSPARRSPRRSART